MVDSKGWLLSSRASRDEGVGFRNSFLFDGSSYMLSQLFEGSHTGKLQDQFRQGLQLKGDPRGCFL